MARKAKKPATLGENIKSILTIVLGVIIVRIFIFQPFTIPSGSMEPGLIEGDYIIVSKFSTGYGQHAARPFFTFPAKNERLMKRGVDRGDVIVFRPQDLNQDYIKRVIGLPGDTVTVSNHTLSINGEAVPVTVEGDIYRETLDGRSAATYHRDAPGPNTSAPDGTYIVPAGYYFVLGDNRDNSLDGRVKVRNGGAGYVPSANIVGEAKFILLSVEDDFTLIKPWTWYKVRSDRWFKAIR